MGWGPSVGGWACLQVCGAPLCRRTLRAAPAKHLVMIHAQPTRPTCRFFAPWAGIDEDPVTGSAHAVMAPYFARRLGRKTLRARQCSPRGGDVLMRLGEPEGPEEGRVVVSGAARVVLRGQLLL